MSTREVEIDDRFDFFRDVLCRDYVGILPLRPGEGAFSEEVLAYEQQGLMLSRIHATGHEAERTPSTISATPDDAYFFNFSPDAVSAR